ncbi:ketol-acid reductoisomerase [Ferrimonas sediminum]|uniref:Ketol-acid reductoisomerase (NADP(+)) n=1 Tax=Ferrimonas sediminum TaxID=718193 RepID=A0A1G8JN19_9GAMM|nr:ketol-acid reductoisomerase [Ferrimonas sediminum]SDI32689.1 ketol-acid reductoisomerase [Ferrimonas sediminum]
MTQMYHQADANPSLLQGKTVAVLGYGSQGRGQSLNLRDSGVNVVIGLRPGGASWKQAEEEGWQPVPFADAVRDADIVMVLIPDMAQADNYKEFIEPNIKDGAMLMFSHGLNVHYGMIEPASNIDVAMVAPKGPGYLVRTEYEKGAGVPCLMAVHQDASGYAHARALAYADAIGGTRGGVLTTNFKEETETDLFGEQAVLCGGAVAMVRKGWETLVEAGYQPELAYFECLHELKLIVDLLYEGGISRMHEFVSDTAAYGALTRGDRIVDDRAKETMKQVLAEIQSGEFTRQWVEEYKAGSHNYRAAQEAECNHPIEKVGADLRSRMSWLNRGE